ncbi:hypothetical Protein YC6258_02678 [Gynuella sunshinyii YC6258]|uniref:Uncharacterized protein n=1 Tax=Gynuella sunshinyii YC6258 TaxID=1445510 RepID=A0A0C5VKC3_9GAMM|nr:hypothetical Protein YC6258_02678 [Gynuella sunshinyii YC6258]
MTCDGLTHYQPVTHESQPASKKNTTIGFGFIIGEYHTNLCSTRFSYH